MNVQTIESDTWTARKLWKEYRAAVQKRASKEDEELARGYFALSRGQKVISARAAIVAGGWDQRGLPKLALCKAAAQACHVQCGRFRVSFQADSGSWWRSRARRNDRLTFDALQTPETGREVAAWAHVPLVPPRYRPDGDLDGYFLLWEAVWRDAAPADPMLLKRLGHDLFAVLAVWELTPLEQRVLEAFRGPGR